MAVISRRATGRALLAATAATVALPGALLFGCGAAWARPPAPLLLPTCDAPLEGQLAAALTRAVYSTVVEMKVMGEEDFQREAYKLREREYRYYAEANRSRLPRVPDLADNTGGLSNPSYFNFLSYCLWKVVYRHMTAPEDREAFARRVAAEFLSRAWPEAGRGRGVAADRPSDGILTAPTAVTPPLSVVRSVVLPLLERLRAGGYICRYQVVLGGHPGTWPQDWMVSQPAVMWAETEADALPDLLAAAGSGRNTLGDPPAESSPPGEAVLEACGSSCGEFLFQVKLHQPADIMGNVALRSEEGGAWPRTVSHGLLLLLQQQGYGSGKETGRAESWEAGGQVQLPGAGVKNSAGLQGEGALAVHGVAAAAWAECDEFFYQDQWQGPKSWTDRVLLFFGDPLEQVGVDFVPSTLVQNWRLWMSPA